MEIKWTDADPATGQRRFLCAEWFAGVWRFRWKLQRRGEWTRGLEPTRAMWEHILESLQRRYRRREGVDDDDIEQVEKILAGLPEEDAAAACGLAHAPGCAKPQAADVHFGADETIACQRLVVLAMEEDIGPGDATSQAVIPADLTGSAVFVARRAGVLAGLPAAALAMHAVDAGLRFQPFLDDGAMLKPGQRLALVAGSMRSILAAERMALNFLQHLSGVATLTRQYVDAVAGLTVRILDTRKTLPGWRLLQKYAVRCGGGHNHRLGLFDGILIKDNHLAALPIADRAEKIAEAVRLARQWQAEPGRAEPRKGPARAATTTHRPLTGFGAPGVGTPGLALEIEVDDLDQFDAALACRPSIVLLDNMTIETMREAVRRRDRSAPHVQLEASGGVTLQTVRGIAAAGVDRISIGALTHSAPALDIALDYE